MIRQEIHDADILLDLVKSAQYESKKAMTIVTIIPAAILLISVSELFIVVIRYQAINFDEIKSSRDNKSRLIMNRIYLIYIFI